MWTDGVKVVDGCMQWQTEEQVGWTDGQMDGWTNEMMCEQM